MSKKDKVWNIAFCISVISVIIKAVIKNNWLLETCGKLGETGRRQDRPIKKDKEK